MSDIDHEEQFVQDMETVEAEFMDATRRGFQAGESRVSTAPVQLRARIHQLVTAKKLPLELAGDREDGIPVVDHAAALLGDLPLREGLWNENIFLEFGEDADNLEFVNGFLIGLAFPGQFETLFAERE